MRGFRWTAKRRWLMVLLWLALLALLAAPVMAAQEVPPTAGEAVGLIEAGLVALAGLLGWAITDAIRKWTWLPEEDRSRIGGAAANLVAAIVSAASGFIVGWLGQWAGLLDTSGIWAVVIFVWPAAKGWFELTNGRKMIAQLVASRVRGE